LSYQSFAFAMSHRISEANRHRQSTNSMSDC
jgi:hypothetical protein